MNMGDFCHDQHYFHRNCWFHARCPDGQLAFETYLEQYKEGLLGVIAVVFPHIDAEVQYRRLESQGRLGHLGIYPKGAIVTRPQVNPLATAFVPGSPQLNPLAMAFVPGSASSPSSTSAASAASAASLVAPDTPPTPPTTLSPPTSPKEPLDARVMRYTEDWCDDEYINGVFD